MRTVGFTLLVCFLTLTISGCAGFALGPPLSGYFTGISYPHIQAVADDGKVGSKSGEAEASSILGLFTFGDASVLNAARNGGITEIKTIDHHFTSFLGIYSSFSTKVTGE